MQLGQRVLNQNQNNAQGRDFLTVRLKRMVKTLLNEERDAKKEPLFMFLLSNHLNLKTRFVWCTIFCLCVALFVYQSYDRVAYFYTYPVAVDVFIKQTKVHKFPTITLCYQETEESLRHTNGTHRFKKWACHNEVPRIFIEDFRGINMTDVWKKLNTTTALHSAHQITAAGSFPLIHYNVVLPYGYCTAFKIDPKSPLVDVGHQKFEIVMKKYKGSCADTSTTNILIYDLPAFILGLRWQHHPIGARMEIGISSRELSFGNVPTKPCISGEDYVKCHENCYANYLNKIGKCRFPFFPKQVIGPICLTGSRESITQRGKAAEYVTGASNEKPCQCTRKCSHRFFAETFFNSAGYKNQSVYVLKYDDDYETLIKERRSYFFIDLLCDVGGNSGLYIGLSLLSIFQLINKATDQISRKRKPNQFRATDPIFRIVNRTYKKCKAFRSFPLKQHLERKSCSMNILKFLNYGMCAAVLIFAIVNRISYYFNNPVRSLIEVKNVDMLSTIPTITICPGSPERKKLQRQIAKQKNYKDYCEVKPWELLELKYVTANQVWNNPVLEKGSDIFFHPFHIEVLMDGTCYDFDVEQTNRNGSPIFYNFRLWYRSNLESLCGTYHQKLYIKRPSGFYDYFQYRHLPTNHQLTIMLIIKELKLDSHDCVSEEQNELCKLICLNFKLLSRIKCRLPYMPKFNMSDCNTPSSAKHSHLTYLDLFLVPTSTDDCNCWPKCVTTIYDTRAYVLPERPSMMRTSFFYYLAYTVIEIYEKQPSYPLVKLLCDIGGWLGATFGFCILTGGEAMLLLLNSNQKQKKSKQNSKKPNQISKKVRQSLN